MQDEGFHDHAVTNLLVTWGQYLDHDITLTGETKDNAGKTPNCCQVIAFRITCAGYSFRPCWIHVGPS